MALNVQADLRRRLEEKFTDVKVSVTVPFERPEKLITVMRMGGSRRDDLVDAPIVGIYCYAPTEQEAWQLANDVADFMARLEFGDGYISSKNEAMYSDRDEKTNSPRWYLSYSLLTYVVKGN